MKFLSATKRVHFSQELTIATIFMRFPSKMFIAIGFHLLALLWINSFMEHSQKLFVSQAVSTWYFGERFYLKLK